ncbi:ATP-binding protein [Micavibrio aeruginosavorus]|uniref:ATP-binding protein n=1 Tax=Micavibrio aeruginosavorus (strain ARL-13) TaxID=856793 RepID=G2KRL0_MICAA|nr:ATP-binding protein [Micavibrio aeruginosavorus]AEP09572.1 hypothetical protein MICA_1249 [Micavibrio aeruginosavorus ARL-13]
MDFQGKPASKAADGPRFQLKENLGGRIRNLALSPSYDNTIIPLFEAISNSIHSIQERFGAGWIEKGKIKIQIVRDEEGNPTSFSVEDNGAGLNEENFESFLTYDSSHKIQKGGKGVGRLTWLKVFEKVHVDSFFKAGNEIHRRSFNFILDNDNPFQNYNYEERSQESSSRTTVFLQNLKGRYNTTCIKKTELITHKIIAHFLPFLIGDECPDISVEDINSKHEVRDIISENTHNPKIDKFEIEDIGSFEIQHLLLHKSIVEKAEHKIYVSAHGRIVYPHIINNQTGLNTYFEYEDQQVAYVGILSSDLLDENVTQERNNFDIEKDKFEEILRKAVDCSKLYLQEQIDEIIEAKSYTVETVLNRFPRYKYLVKDKKEFARSLPLNAKKEEEIYKAMSVYDFRESKETVRQVEEIFTSTDDPDSIENLEEIYAQLVEKISEQEQASLAEYVVKRKTIIDLLEKRLGYEDTDKQKKYKEDAIHRIICPLRTNSGEVSNNQHNLWLLDDRLAFYDYWASDLNIVKFAKESESKDRPDIVLFKGSNLFHRKGTDQPHIIVEFKRPAREDYSDEENPLKQVYGYIRELREKTINDKNGRLITQIKESTPFFCYIVCDVTPKLLEVLENLDMNRELPGERGYYGYNKSLNAYVEILEYDQIVKDARLRNEAFFEKLGIN